MKEYDENEVKFDLESIKKSFEEIKNRDNSDIVDIFKTDTGDLLEPWDDVESIDEEKRDKIKNLFDEIFSDPMKEQLQLLMGMDDENDEADLFSQFSFKDPNGNRLNILYYTELLQVNEIAESVSKILILRLLIEEGANILYTPIVMENGKLKIVDKADAIQVGNFSEKNMSVNKDERETEIKTEISDELKNKFKEALEKANESIKEDFMDLPINTVDADGKKENITKIKIDDGSRQSYENLFNEVTADDELMNLFDLAGFKKVVNGQEINIKDEVVRKLNEEWNAFDEFIENGIKIEVLRALSEPDTKLIYDLNGVKVEFGSAFNAKKYEEQLNKAKEDKIIEEQIREENEQREKELEENNIEEENSDQDDNIDEEYIEKSQQDLDREKYAEYLNKAEKYLKNGKNWAEIKVEDTMTKLGNKRGDVASEMKSLRDNMSFNLSFAFHDNFKEFIELSKEIAGDDKGLMEQFAVQNEDGTWVSIKEYADSLFGGNTWYDSYPRTQVEYQEALLMRCMIEKEGKVIFRPAVLEDERKRYLNGLEIDAFKIKEIPLNLEGTKEEKLSENAQEKVRNLLDSVLISNEDIDRIFDAQTVSEYGTYKVTQLSEHLLKESENVFDHIFNGKDAHLLNMQGFKIVRDGKVENLPYETIKKELSEKWRCSERNVNSCLKTEVIRALAQPNCEVIYDYGGIKASFGGVFERKVEKASNDFLGGIFDNAYSDVKRDKRNKKLEEDAKKEESYHFNVKAHLDNFIKGNHSEIYDLYCISFAGKKNVTNSDDVSFYRINDLEQNVVDEVVKKFDECFGGVLELDDKFFDHIKLTADKSDKTIDFKELFDDVAARTISTTKKMSPANRLFSDYKNNNIYGAADKNRLQNYRKYIFIQALTSANIVYSDEKRKINMFFAFIIFLWKMKKEKSIFLLLLQRRVILI